MAAETIIKVELAVPEHSAMEQLNAVVDVFCIENFHKIDHIEIYCEPVNSQAPETLIQKSVVLMDGCRHVFRMKFPNLLPMECRSGPPLPDSLFGQ